MKENRLRTHLTIRLDPEVMAELVRLAGHRKLVAERIRQYIKDGIAKDKGTC